MSSGEEAIFQGLSYWSAIEMLTPQAIPPVDHNQMGERSTQIVEDYDAGGSGRHLPWSKGSSFAPGKIVNHTVYVGQFQLARISALLPQDPITEDVPSTDVGCLAAFEVNDSGIPKTGSLIIPTSVWAAGKLVHGCSLIDNDWISLFDEEHEAISNAFDAQVNHWVRRWKAVALAKIILADNAQQKLIGLAVNEIFELLGISDFSDVLKVYPDLGISLESLEIPPYSHQATNDLFDMIVGELKCKALFEPAKEYRDRILSMPHTQDAEVQPQIERILVNCSLLDMRYRIKTKCVAKNEKDAVSEDDSFLNSFYLTDLRRAQSLINDGRASACLSSYLKGEQAKKRFDVRAPENGATILAEVLNPALYPEATWPSPGHHPLVFSQQFAVNEIHRTLGEPGSKGIFAVNGPPGTGKTTLLRDVLATVIIERAKLLLRGEDFFSGNAGEVVWHAQDDDKTYPRRVHSINKAFHGFEIVVASSNNGAVENVTEEVPAEGSIDPGWLKDIANPDYFKEIGGLVISKGKPEAKSAWGLIAAPLGNSGNRSYFVSNFFFTPKATQDQVVSRSPGFQQMLSEKSTYLFPDYQGATKVLETALHAEHGFRKKAVAISSSLAEKFRLQQALNIQTDDLGIREVNATNLKAMIEVRRRDIATCIQHHHERLAAADTDGEALEMVKVKAAEQAQTSKIKLAAARKHLARIEAAKPGLIQEIMSMFKARAGWNQGRQDFFGKLDIIEAEHESYAQALEQAVLGVSDHKGTQAAIQADVDAEKAKDSLALQEAAELDLDIERRRAAVESLRQQLAEIDASLRSQTILQEIPGLDVLFEDDAGRERSSPWHFDEWRKARCHALFAALAVHKAYIGSHKKQFSANLQTLMDILNGKGPRHPTESQCKLIRDAWRTLFFVMPVVSTTFAAFGRLFQHHDSESIGWLLIDEAGQAAPQAAVGALMRAQRAVVVGDPMQLDPVSTLPMATQYGLLRAFHLNDRWVPGGTSVQRMCDTISRCGTYMGDNGDSMWVGAPLRVHRRCDWPMFHLANQIAYNGLMVFGKERAPNKTLFGYSTGWIHVASGDNEKNFHPQEIAKLREVLQDMQAQGAAGRDIFVISPFRDTANLLKKEMTGIFGPAATGRSGTIHTAQGKEASVVILVLGGGKPGARAWAASKPNLLNVAATRAKTVFLVIGNRQAWAGLQYFGIAAGPEERGGLPLLTEELPV